MKTMPDRLPVEVARGGAAAGWGWNAPTPLGPGRERSPGEVVAQVEANVHTGGWEEIALVATTPCTYGALDDLVAGLAGELAAKRVAVTLPPVLPEAFTPKVAQALARTRKTPLTLVPSGGARRGAGRCRPCRGGGAARVRLGVAGADALGFAGQAQGRTQGPSKV